MPNATVRRATEVKRRIQQGRTDSRPFFTLFEEGDGDEMVALLTQWSHKDAGKLRQYALRARWINLVGAQVVWDGKPWDVVRHEQGGYLTLRTFDRNTTAEVSPLDVQVLERTHNTPTPDQ